MDGFSRNDVPEKPDWKLARCLGKQTEGPVKLYQVLLPRKLQ